MPFVQQDENNENQNNSKVTTGSGSGTSGVGSTATSNQSNPQSKQGSGRFTNLNKYVGANQQGSANLSNRLGMGIQNQLNAKEQDVTTQSNRVKSDIDTGTQTVSQAKEQQQNLQGIADQFKNNQNFSILNNNRGQFGQAQTNLQQFAQNPNYANFKTFQAGQGIDEQALNTAQENARQNAANYQNLFKQRQQQIGSAAGRDQALNEFVGGANQLVRPTYSTGQRRLDQLVMSQNPTSLKNLINTVGSNESKVNNALGFVNTNQQNLQNLTKSEQDTINAINESAKAAQTGFQGAFDQNKINELNTERANKFKQASDALSRGEVSQDLYSRLGDANRIQGETTLFNLMQNSDLGSQNRFQNDYLQRLADAQSANDIVSQQDVDTDAALAGIVGQGQRFTQAGNTGTNVDWRMASKDQTNFTNALLDEQKRQTDAAKNTNLGMEAYGGESYLNDQNVYDALSGMMSGKARTTIYSPTGTNQQLKDIVNAGTHNMFNADRNVGTIGQSFDANYNTNRDIINNLYNGNYLADSNQATQDIMLANNPQLANEIIANRRGADMSSINQALDSRYTKLKDYMQQRGFGNRLNIV